ncbi:MAG: SsrA-binding protein SmpB [Candidatus Omnitrophica bacterium]|nr:SsrA-binding protein SmpB [Candidatus Omnitrophota bacterium]
MGQLLITNRKAGRDFFLKQTYECGIALKGCEVKSVRAGKVNFKDTFARVEKGEVLLYNLNIQPYKEASYLNVEPDRVRKLLLHRREIKRIKGATQEKGLSLVPTKIYFNARGRVKIEIALGKGKRMFDKRETIKKRDIERSLGRTLRSRQYPKR